MISNSYDTYDKNDKEYINDGDCEKYQNTISLKKLIENTFDIDVVINKLKRTSYLTLVENGNPILNIRVRNYNKSYTLTQLWSKKKDYIPRKKIQEFLDLDIPFYYCENADQFDKTMNFIKLWINKEDIELYKLYPNKITTINKRIY